MCCSNPLLTSPSSHHGDEEEQQTIRSGGGGSKSMYSLPADYTPSAYTVIVGRGRESKENLGNKRLRVLAAPYLPQYSRAADSRRTKTQIVSVIFDSIHHAGGIFIKRHNQNGQWIQVKDGVAREKIGYVLRDMLSDQYRSSSKSKVEQRKHREQMRTSKNCDGPLLSGTTVSKHSYLLPNEVFSIEADTCDSSDRLTQRPGRRTMRTAPRKHQQERRIRRIHHPFIQTGCNLLLGSFHESSSQEMMSTITQGDMSIEELLNLPLFEENEHSA